MQLNSVVFLKFLTGATKLLLDVNYSPVKTDKSWDVVPGSTLVDYISQSLILNINEY